MRVIATLGAAYSANKGAASMLQALVDNLSQRIGDTRIIAVSTHPRGDRAVYSRAALDVEVAAQRPVQMAVLHFPLAVLAGLLRIAGVPWRWVCRPAALRAIADADVVVDISGISFLDGRRFPVLLYNTLVVTIPLLLGRPVVKCAQAMGPFRTRANRGLAKLVLPRLEAVCPRGTVTEEGLRALDLDNLLPASDLAFIMKVPEEVRRRMRTRLAAAAPRQYIVVAPSQVVDSHCRKHGIDYQEILADFIDGAVDQTDCTIVLVAYAAQPQSGVNHMNDLPLCRAIYRRLRSRERVVFFDEDLLPTELRALVAGGRLLVTSRFHAMIAALTEETPPLVIGWSHKYAEVLEPFGLRDVALSYSDLTSGPALLGRVRDLLGRADELRGAIRAALPGVQADATVNLEAIANALGKEGDTLASVSSADR